VRKISQATKNPWKKILPASKGREDTFTVKLKKRTWVRFYRKKIPAWKIREFGSEA